MANSSTAAARPAPNVRSTTLRWLGVVCLVLLIAVIFAGNQLALGPWTVGALGLHVGLAVLLDLVSGAALLIALRTPGAKPRASAGLTFLTSLGATLAGVGFYFGGQSNGALYAMEGLPVLTLVTAILLIVWGVVELPVRASA